MFEFAVLYIVAGVAGGPRAHPDSVPAPARPSVRPSPRSIDCPSGVGGWGGLQEGGEGHPSGSPFMTAGDSPTARSSVMSRITPDQFRAAPLQINSHFPQFIA